MNGSFVQKNINVNQTARPTGDSVPETVSDIDKRIREIESQLTAGKVEVLDKPEVDDVKISEEKEVVEVTGNIVRESH